MLSFRDSNLFASQGGFGVRVGKKGYEEGVV
jgi:hypothetical protein